MTSSEKEDSSRLQRNWGFGFWFGVFFVEEEDLRELFRPVDLREIGDFGLGFGSFWEKRKTRVMALRPRGDL